MAIVAHCDLELHQMDVKIAFLNRNLKKEVYMDQLEGFFVEEKEHIVYKLEKLIYGLKQASWQWYIKFNDIITSFGFKENTINLYIYLKVSENKYIFFIIYIDDILLATNDHGLLHEIEKFLSINLKMKNIGEHPMW